MDASVAVLWSDASKNSPDKGKQVRWILFSPSLRTRNGSGTGRHFCDEQDFS